MEEKIFTPTENQLENGVNVQELADPVQVLGDATPREGNSHFADMRRKQQLEKLRADNILLQKDIESLKAAAIPAEPSVESASLMAQVNMFKQRETDRLMAEDLKEIQSVDATVTSLDDLPPAFLALRFNSTAPLTAKQAFLAVKNIEAQLKPQKPASAGSIASAGTPERDFYTADELDSLTPAMLENPKVMEKALRSMARLK